MMKRMKVLLFLLCISSLAVGCSSRANDKAKEAGDKPAVAVDAVRASALDLDEGVDVVGSLSAKFQADVKAEYPGIVTRIHVAEWIRVRQGTPLAQLDTRELELMLQKSEASVEASKANVMQAEVAVNRAEREYARLLKLKEAGLVTQQSLDDGATDREASAARVGAARAQLRAARDEFRQMQTRLSKAMIRAPMDGVVSMRNVNVGDFTGDKLLFRIVDNRLLDLTVTVPSSQMAAIAVGQPLVFSTNSLTGKTFTGKVTFINPAVNEADRSVKIVAEVRNEPEELKAGLFVKGRIVTKTRSQVLQVPRIALLSWNVLEKKADVFVVNGDRAQRKAVRTGSVSADKVEVVSGLGVGEPVVVRGSFNLRDGDRVIVAQAAGR